MTLITLNQKTSHNRGIPVCYLGKTPDSLRTLGRSVGRPFPSFTWRDLPAVRPQIPRISEALLSFLQARAGAQAREH
jgi:hypothetical protein